MFCDTLRAKATFIRDYLIKISFIISNKIKNTRLDCALSLELKNLIRYRFFQVLLGIVWQEE